jgi:tetratricopeptide (TPR) repeat protein
MLQERTPEAIRALEDAVRLDPDSPRSYEAWLLLGKLRLTNPAWGNRAIEALQQATRTNPLAADPWVVMAEVYHRKGFKPNAAECYRRALTLDPSIPVPSDVELGDAAPPKAGEPKGEPGFVGRLKGLFGK